MPDSSSPLPKLVPLAWKDRSSLIEHLLPAQKISAEAQKERKAGSGQTLTALGSYWKGRKPLILAKACILGALLPATDDPEADLALFETLMAIDDEAFTRRAKTAKDKATIAGLPYSKRLELAHRPEELPDEVLYAPIWPEVNRHLGTSARSFPELVEQLGILRFGHRPKVGDTFCGAGSIPFEAARLGCDVYASDLNPVACMLTWGALNIIGADENVRAELGREQREAAEAVDREITALGIEHDGRGNRAKVFFYCLETRCPQTGWMVPVAPSWVISKARNVIARLIPDQVNKRFVIDIVTGAAHANMAEAARGTVRDGAVVYVLDGEEYRTPIKTIRGDYRLPGGATGNRLRRWEVHDFKPRPDDIFQERLYCIQWITRESLGKGRHQTFFATITEEDLQREAKVEAIVAENLARWQAEGLVPDMPIEPGQNTSQPIWERGWTYWHHLFTPRQLHLHAGYKKQLTHKLAFGFSNALDWNSKLSAWDPSRDSLGHCFYNQSLNTLSTYGVRASAFDGNVRSIEFRSICLQPGRAHVVARDAHKTDELSHIWITDPPYADAIRYEEITEFFIAWLRKNPPEPFEDWIWDSRRPLAIKGKGDDFRREMIAAYRAMAAHMPDQGLQIVMFTHQDAGVWADMASIVWGAGLRVTAAWYVATETTSELKKGGYVQGTVLLVLRKRLSEEGAYRDELVQEVRDEVARQIEFMVRLNRAARERCEKEVFKGADLQMAGYAAALRVLTGYSRIDGQDMTAQALRPRAKGARDVVKEIIDYAVQVANEHLVPEVLPPSTWARLCASERFYMKMLEMEAAGLKKLDNYQNFAKAFRVADYTALMGSIKANAARLKTAAEFKKAEFDGEFGKTPLRALLFAFWELQREVGIEAVMEHFRQQVADYWSRREDLVALAQAIAAMREKTVPEEASAARILLTAIKDERLGV
jgi:adenine-specific DNA methylase